MMLLNSVLIQDLVDLPQGFSEAGFVVAISDHDV